MRITAFAAALSISLFSSSTTTHAQSTGYVSGPKGWMIVSPKPITRQDIEKFEQRHNVCDKVRFDAGLPYIDVQARYFMQVCMSAPLDAATPKQVAKWHESVGQAGDICKGYASKLAVNGPPAYTYYAAIGLTNCLSAELNHGH